MKPLLRTLILWLVLLAVPFQGVASAAMLGCATGHVPASAPAAAAPIMDHAHHGMHGAEHRMTPVHDAADGGDSGDGHHAAQHGGQGKCGACSACSIGAAMAPAAPLALPVHAPPLLAAPFAGGHIPSVDLALPERPPRLTLV